MWLGGLSHSPFSLGWGLGGFFFFFFNPKTETRTLIDHFQKKEKKKRTLIDKGKEKLSTGSLDEDNSFTFVGTWEPNPTLKGVNVDFCC